MVRSLAVILVPILIITVFFTRYLDDAPVTVVDYQPVLAQARADAPYPVLAPSGLASDWRPTRVSWLKVGDPGLNRVPSVRNLWQLGYLSPDNIYFGVAQGDLQPQSLIDDQSREGLPDGDSQVKDATWKRLVSSDDRTRSLVLASPDVTTIVVGDTSYEDLETFAGTLTSS